ncbi:Bone morphogenetic protein 8B [Apodemus speciosus]|uniref:Bone morphogenetic protein 8B n=1 Tax=Apodemus speciosus TaxID=105296 RepID=A0ABQ0EP89_APOSI
MAARPGLLWPLALALSVLGDGHLSRPPHVFPQRRLGIRDVQREIREVLGLPGRPRPRAPLGAAQQPASAPLFMLDLYHAMTGDSGGGPPQPHLDRADLIMSFVNIDPCGEAVTAAAEFRIYKEPSVHITNTTLHISMFEVVQEHSNRESDLLWIFRRSTWGRRAGWCWTSQQPVTDGCWTITRTWDSAYVETSDGRHAHSASHTQWHSMDPGLAGLLGRQAPRSRQPFVVGSSGPAELGEGPLNSKTTEEAAAKSHQPAVALQHTPRNLCYDGHSSHGREVCRRHELYVRSRDLGWLGYSAYYCAGECIYPLNSCMNSTNHATMQALVHLLKPDVIPKVCCVPTELSAISLLYYDRNSNVILRRERNMVVQACGCH